MEVIVLFGHEVLGHVFPEEVCGNLLLLRPSAQSQPQPQAVHQNYAESEGVHIVLIVGEASRVLLGPVFVELVDAFNRLLCTGVIRAVVPPQGVVVLRLFFSLRCFGEDLFTLCQTGIIYKSASEH